MSGKETIIRYTLLAPVALAPLAFEIDPYVQVVAFCLLFGAFALLDQWRYLERQIKRDDGGRG